MVDRNENGSEGVVGTGEDGRESDGEGLERVEWVRTVQRAREVLGSLEEERPAPAGMPETARRSSGSAPQLDLFSAARPSEVERVLGEIDLDRITPLEALALLTRLKGMLDDD